jgi:membrane protease YdiL (CAAX protease family)
LVVIFVKMLNGASMESVRAWAESSNAVLLFIIATFPAEALIFLFCWAVVTGRGKRPFFESLGWNWAGRSAMYWCLVAVGVVIAINIASNFLLRWLPERPSPFEEMLNSSQPVRIGTVLLAVLAAPLVEEIVYRGVLFSALRKRLNAIATVLAVTVIFVGVHIPQYRGAWRTVAGLTLLSLALTILRARTSSVLPSFLVHLLNNTLSSVVIMLDKD